MHPYISVTAFFQSFVMRTPQGWAWIASSAILFALAVAVFTGFIQLPVGETPTDQAMVCLISPFLTFVLLVESGLLVSSAPSWPVAAGLVFFSAAPVLLVNWGPFYG